MQLQVSETSREAKPITQLSKARLLRLKPAAEYLGLSVWTLRAIVQRGELKIVKYSENAPWLLDIRELDAWVERNKTEL